MQVGVNLSQLVLRVQEYLRCRAAGKKPEKEQALAWNEFYREAQRHITRYALACGLPADELPDCTQQVWSDLVRVLPQMHYDPSRGRLTTWLFPLVRNTVADYFRRRLRHRRTTALTPKIEASLPAEERVTSRHQQMELLHNALVELSRRYPNDSYRVLHLRMVEGMPVREVATALGMTAHQVWFRQNRMKKKLVELCRTIQSESRGASVGYQFPA